MTTSGHFAMMLLACVAVPALGLQGLVSRPALMRCSHATGLRCAPLRAVHGDGEIRVDFDDSGDECVITDAGSTCLDADVAGPIRVDGLDEERRTREPVDQGHHRRSPGLMSDFSALSTDDFKKPYVPPSERQAVPVRRASHSARRPSGQSFPFFEPRNMPNSIVVP
jgi:hypothetical protein